MPVAAQMKNIDSRQLELLQKQMRARLGEWRFLGQGPKAAPVKLLQCVVEVAPGKERAGRMLHVRGGGRCRSLQVAGGGCGHSHIVFRVMFTSHQEG